MVTKFVCTPVTTAAAVVREAGTPFAIETLTLSPPKMGEIVVELEACGICHADIAAQNGGIPFPLPGVLGHEGVGRIVEIGPNVVDRKLGERVVLSFASCGKCSSCSKGKPAYCREWPRLNLTGGGREDGSTSLCCGHGPIHSHYFGQSSFSQYAVVAARSAVPVPDDIPAEILAPLGCGVQTGINAATRVLSPKPGDRVAVFGVGAVGISAIMGLRLTGASQIIAIDVHQSRLSLARKLGATDALNSREESIGDRLLELTKGEGLNGAIETSGKPEVLRAAISSLASAGTCVVIGVPQKAEPGSFDVMDLVARGLRIVGTNQGNADPHLSIPHLLELYKKGDLPIEKIVTTFDLKDINRAIGASNDGNAVKAVIKMR